MLVWPWWNPSWWHAAPRIPLDWFADADERNGIVDYVKAVREVASTHPSVHVLPWYTATLPRSNMHVGGKCSYRPPGRMAHRDKVRELLAQGLAENVSALLANEVLRVARDCCDCLHFCYSPRFFDVAFMTPLYAIASSGNASGASHAADAQPHR